jgi:hypothetical protein
MNAARGFAVNESGSTKEFALPEYIIKTKIIMYSKNPIFLVFPSCTILSSEYCIYFVFMVLYSMCGFIPAFSAV